MISKQDVLSLVRQLPVMPRAITELQRLLTSPDTTVDQVVRVIKTDPTLSTNILRLANSAAFGLSRKVVDIPHAVTLMGFKVLGNLASTAAFAKMLPAELPGYRLTASQFLRHSYAVGVLSESLAVELHMPGGPPYYTAGLLHDIGKLVLGAFIASHSDVLCTILESQQLAFVDAERQILGVDHTQAAAWVGEHWNLPADLVSAAQLHHQPDGAPIAIQPMVDLVSVADASAHCLGFGADLGELARRVDKGAFARLSLSSALLEKVTSSALERLTQELPNDDRPSTKPDNTQRLRVLVADDSSIARQMVLKNLGLAGLPPYDVVEVGDGAQALARLREPGTRFDLVLADIHMPNMTGMQLLGKMVEDERLRATPVVIVSSDGNAANHQRLQSLGVRAILRKPFRPEQFRSVVRSVLTDLGRCS